KVKLHSAFPGSGSVPPFGPLLPDLLRIDGDSTDFGFTAGITLTPWAGTVIGLGYRSRIDHDITGDIFRPAFLLPVPPVVLAFPGRFGELRGARAAAGYPPRQHSPEDRRGLHPHGDGRMAELVPPGDDPRRHCPGRADPGRAQQSRIRMARWVAVLGGRRVSMYSQHHPPLRRHLPTLPA